MQDITFVTAATTTMEGPKEDLQMADGTSPNSSLLARYPSPRPPVGMEPLFYMCWTMTMVLLESY